MHTHNDKQHHIYCQSSHVDYASCKPGAGATCLFLIAASAQTQSFWNFFEYSCINQKYYRW